VTRIKVGSYEPEHLSFSTISTYRQCGKRLQLQKVMGLEERPGIAALAGNTAHGCAEVIDRLIATQGWEALDLPEYDPTQPPF